MNPYEVLGVSPSASQEEIREAYMKLVKKYHPDRYQDSDLKKQAEDKMKQINSAYDLLTKKQSSGSAGSSSGASSGAGYGGYGAYGGYGGYGGTYGTGGYGGYGAYGSYGQYSRQERSSYTGQYAEEFRRARSFISAGSIQAAETLLASIPLRNAEWNYLYGMCCYRSGQYARAYEYISRAVQMDPSNGEYRSALASMRGASSASRGWTARGGDYSLCTTCGSIVCANMLCSLCCRGH
ncbi:MAG: DnaJ domain-containing protein [Clostridia bacterium]|nr:DnaJ domain-containing protein [Clostridia bacterium]